MVKASNSNESSRLDEYYMTLALEQAKKASTLNEVPVGAIIVEEDFVISAAHNSVRNLNDPSCHAEVLAVRMACDKKKNFRLKKATIYVTIEPCTMCFGLLIHTRVRRLVFGAREPKAGVISSNLALHLRTFYNHKIEVTGGILAPDCGEMMSGFFSCKR